MKNMVQKPNSIVHVEIHSNAPEKTKSFLKDVFGWKFEDMPQMNYSMFQPPSAPGGGLQQAENLPAGVLNYVLTEDIENTLRKVTSSGAPSQCRNRRSRAWAGSRCSRTRPGSRWPSTRRRRPRVPPERPRERWRRGLGARPSTPPGDPARSIRRRRAAARLHSTAGPRTLGSARSTQTRPQGMP